MTHKLNEKALKKIAKRNVVAIRGSWCGPDFDACVDIEMRNIRADIEAYYALISKPISLQEVDLEMIIAKPLKKNTALGSTAVMKCSGLVIAALREAGAFMTNPSPTDAPTQDDVERVARALCINDNGEPDSSYDSTGENDFKLLWSLYIPEAKAALAAMPSVAQLRKQLDEAVALLDECREHIDGEIDVIDDGNYSTGAPNNAMKLAVEIDALLAKHRAPERKE